MSGDSIRKKNTAPTFAFMLNPVGNMRPGPAPDWWHTRIALVESAGISFWRYSNG